MANDLVGNLLSLQGQLRITTALGSVGGWLPTLSGTIEASNHGMTLAGELPALAGGVEGVTEVVGWMSSVMPSLGIDLHAKDGEVASLRGTLPRLSGNVYATPQRIGRVVGALPLLSGTVSGSTVPVGQILGVLPRVSGSLVTLTVVSDATTLCVNAATHAVSAFTNYAFDSFVEHDGRYYGIKDDGIYLLDGADDSGTDIVPVIQTGQSDLGTSKRKAVPGVYVAGEFTRAVVTPILDDAEEGIAIALDGTEGPEVRRAKLPRGYASHRWGFRVSGAERVDSIEIDTVAESRRIGRFD